MRTFTVTNLKGGVGKTTTALALAGLLQSRGFRVLIVDLDPQASMTALMGLVPERVEHGTQDLFVSPHWPPHSPPHFPPRGIVKFEGFDLLPTSPALARAERMQERPDGLGGVLHAALRTQSSSYHFALVDAPPALGMLQINAIAAAERLIVPVQCEQLALEGLRRLDATLAMIARSRAGRVPRRLIVPTMVDFRTRAAHFALNTLREHWPTELWAGWIPEDTALREASRLGRLPHLHAPRSRAVLAYQRLMIDLLTDGGAYVGGEAPAAPTGWRPQGAVL